MSANSKRSPGALFVVAGAPAVGKSTVGRSLADSFGRSVHLPIDDVRHSVRGGLVLPRSEWPDELVEQISLARLACLDVAGRYRRAGFAVVLDDTVDPLLLKEYSDLSSDRDAVRVILRPTEAAAVNRNRARPVKEQQGPDILDRAIRFVYGILERHGDDLENDGWITIDTTELTVEGTVARIIALRQPGHIPR